jgi:N-acetylglucosamine kinase-like BadF-type ATPase
VTGRIALAVDGGNSKTDLALLREDGALLAHVRGGLSSPHHLGLDGAMTLLEQLHGAALGLAGQHAGAVADAGRFLLAGLDFPAEERRLHKAVSARGWARSVEVGNDTFAVLRAGTERGWGVAVVCGAGINCVGVGPDGRHVRFPALGAISGDWGGGFDVGLAALSAAARSEDGRGPATALERAVPAYFGVATPAALAEAIHVGVIPLRRLVELPPVVFDTAALDRVAAGIVDRLAGEVVTLVHVTLRRLDLADGPVDVLLGGGLLRGADGRLMGAIRDGLEEFGDAIALRLTESPPIVGAALLALDDLGADRAAQDRARRELVAAVKTEVETMIHG